MYVVTARFRIFQFIYTSGNYTVKKKKKKRKRKIIKDITSYD